MAGDNPEVVWTARSGPAAAEGACVLSHVRVVGDLLPLPAVTLRLPAARLLSQLPDPADLRFCDLWVCLVLQTSSLP